MKKPSTLKDFFDRLALFIMNDPRLSKEQRLALLSALADFSSECMRITEQN